MQKFIFLLVIFAEIVITSNAQNLVPNPSFENSAYCNWEVWGQTSGKGADEWDSYQGSCDYMNDCNSWSWAEFMGPQIASSGNGYAGFYAHIGNKANRREILGGKLLEPLFKGREYYISIKFSLAEGYPNSACNNVGVLFLNKGYSSTTFSTDPCSTCLNYLPGYAHVYSEEVIKDYEGWTEVSGYFIADSSYTHLAIGNFFKDSQTMVEEVFPNNRGKRDAYYYVDDVSVTDTGVCTTEDCKVSLDLPNVFTPNNDGTNDLFVPLDLTGITRMHTSVYNRWGKRVFFTDKLMIEWNGKIDNGAYAPTGLYYWLIDFVDRYNTKETIKGWISLER